jgi:hypothetical protein
MTERSNKDRELIMFRADEQPPVDPVIPVPPAKTEDPANEEAWWKEAAEKHGFKSKEDLWKSYQASERKISEDGEKLKNFQIFQDNVVPVLDVVLKDEDILKRVKGKMENPTQDPPKDPALDPLKKVNTDDADIKKSLIDDTVARFESSHGIDKLDPETQKEVKAKIGIEFKKFASDGNIKVSEVKGQLEDAFALAVAKDDKLKTIFNPKEDTPDGYGSMPSQSSGIGKDGNIILTPAEEKVAQNMPGGRESYIEGKKKVLGIK